VRLSAIASMYPWRLACSLVRFRPAQARARAAPGRPRRCGPVPGRRPARGRSGHRLAVGGPTGADRTRLTRT
jgi:hypothetical protein